MDYQGLEGIQVKLFWSQDYIGRKTGAETVNKSAWIVESLMRHPIDAVKISTPRLLTEEQLLSAHSELYVRALLTGMPEFLADSGLPWDEHTWVNVRATNGGVVAAVREAIATEVSGTLSSGLHHARHHTGVAFCSVNGLAIAAFDALADNLVDRVLILDVDGHGGGGTESIVRGDHRIMQIDITTDEFDLPARSSRSWSFLPPEGSVAYLATLSGALDRFIREVYEPKHRWVVIYNAGMDADLNGFALAQRETLVFEWAHRNKLPIAFTLAGGYLWDETRESLVDKHRLTIAAASLRRTR